MKRTIFRLQLIIALLLSLSPLASASDTARHAILSRMFTTGDYFGFPGETAQPFACTSLVERSVYYDTTAHSGYICNGTSWVSTSGPTLPLSVANGGTGLTSGTSGGILGFTASGTLASSAALTANAIVLGGGAGATPTVLGSLGSTTTVLHGNAAGAPTFGAVALGTDVSGQLPLANGGTNANLTASNGGIFYSTGSAGAILAGTATAGQALLSGSSTTPAWTTVTFPSTAANNTTLVSNGTAFSAAALPACTDSGGNHLNYNAGSFTCGTSSSGSGANTTLSNLGTTAINADLLSGSTGTINIGSATNHFATGFFGTATNAQYAEITHNGTDATITTGTGGLDLTGLNSHQVKFTNFTINDTTAQILSASNGGSDIGSATLGFGQIFIHRVTAPTTLGQLAYIHLADGNNSLASARHVIGVGGSTTSIHPCEFGGQVSSTAGFTEEDLYFACRNVTTNSAPTEYLRIDHTGEVRMPGPGPAVSSCGTSPSAVTGSDKAGHLTAGSGALTACVMNFSTTLTTTPECMCTNQSSAANPCSVTATSTTSFTMSGAVLTSDVLSWICLSGT